MLTNEQGFIKLYILKPTLTPKFPSCLMCPDYTINHAYLTSFIDANKIIPFFSHEVHIPFFSI